VKVPLMQQQQLSRQWLQKSGVIYPLIHDTRLQVAAAAALEDKTDEEDMTSLEISHGYDLDVGYLHISATHHSLLGKNKKKGTVKKIYYEFFNNRPIILKSSLINSLMMLVYNKNHFKIIVIALIKRLFLKFGL
jgi:hypothetical protein